MIERMITGAESTYVALLRGVNVGGKNRLPMRDLTAMFTLAGCEAVETYIQSGNVVFKAESVLVARIPTLIASAVEERFGYRVPVVVRTVEEMRDIVKGNPFLSTGVDAKRLHVAFLTDVPDSDGVAQLDPDHSPPDAFHVRGREIYLYCPNGLGRSKLTNDYFDSRLNTATTIRNWRTTLTLVAMADG